MQDPIDTRPLPAPPRRRTGRRIFTGLLLLLVLGLGVTTWLAWTGRIDLLGKRPPASAPLALRSPAPVPSASSAAPSPAPQAAQPATIPIGTVEARLALLEERLSRLDLQASAASGNAARAEGLLIAFAARRTIDRGAQLGYLEDQLKLRFADAQPNAVRTIIEASHSPATLDGLLAQLDALAPKLDTASANDDTWTVLKREMAGLFVIRRESSTPMKPEDCIQRAKLLLATGRALDAITEIQRLPGSSGASQWIAAVRRYDQVQRALDLIETTAMLDPRNLRDSQARRVGQASPLAGPTASPSPSPALKPNT